MNKRTSATARIFAVLALIAAFVLVVVAIGGALGGGSDDSSGQGRGEKAARRAEPRKPAPASYEIKSGDTLLAIAHRTGVSVARIERLNPEVDPQILIAGETLKLR
ncbi:MAG TPA: LysM domain-containing protein [Solirubrobacterales bacterium]|nr:LysM domain-containing protein [Solirubrobacterales bacterium]